MVVGDASFSCSSSLILAFASSSSFFIFSNSDSSLTLEDGGAWRTGSAMGVICGGIMGADIMPDIIPGAISVLRFPGNGSPSGLVV